jgi:hypothetical protein
VEGWDSVAEQEYVVRLDNAGGLDYVSNCSEKRVVALAEVEFHFVFVFLFLSFGFLPFDGQTF